MDGKGKDVEYKVEQKEPMVIRETATVEYQAIPHQVAPIYVEVADEVNPVKLYTGSELVEEFERRTKELWVEAKKYELEGALYRAEIDWLSNGEAYTVEEVEARLDEKYESQFLSVNDFSHEVSFYTEEEFKDELANRVREVKRHKQMKELGASLYKGELHVLKGGKTYTIEELEAELDKKYGK